MKVLMINGSPHSKGNTYVALHEMEKIFLEEGIKTEIVQVGNKDIRGCANATLSAFLDRLFYNTQFDKTMKVGACAVAARRGGLSAAFDQLNKYFTITGMPVASSQYWNGIHGREPGEARQDEEGLQTMRTLAKNMAFLIKSIALGKEAYGLPEKEEFQQTNFIR